MRVKKQTLHFPKTRHILVKFFYKKTPKYLQKVLFMQVAAVSFVLCVRVFFCPYVAKKRLFLMKVSWLYSITSCNKSDNMTFITQTTTAEEPEHTKNWLKSFLKEHFYSVEGHFNPGLFSPKLRPQTFKSWTFQPQILNHEFLNHGVEKFMVEKSEVENSGVEMSSL